MQRKSFTAKGFVAAFAVAGLAVLTACGGGSTTGTPVSDAAGGVTDVAFVAGTAQQNGAPDNTGDFAAGGDVDAAAQWVELDSTSVGKLNPVVVNGKGLTLYRFDDDAANPSKSTCDGDCAKTWPPVLLKPGGRVFLNGVDKADVGTVARADGSRQITLGGWPVYRFAKDSGPGQAGGQGVAGKWFGVTPEGEKTGKSPEGTDAGSDVDYNTGTARENNADMNAGDFYRGSRGDDAAKKWVQLSRGSAGGLNPIVHDGAGFTLYRFDKDTANPSKSTCDGDCAKTWPPVLVKPGSRIFVNGVAASKIGVVQRSDGTRQVTIGGWPVYRFSKDTGPGQTNGEGVGGTWFAVSPTGGKVTAPMSGSSGATAPSATAPSISSAPTGTAGSSGSSSAPASAPGGSVQLRNGSAILDTGKNFSEPNGSFGVAGPGCVANPQPQAVSSIVLAGGPVKLWKGPNCTGQSTVITDSVPDLGAIGFDKQVASIRFGDS